MTGGWHLYLLRCRDGSLYAGITTDVERRFREHTQGRGARYTRSHPPEAVLGSRSYPDRASASSPVSPGWSRRPSSGYSVLRKRCP